MEPNKNLTEELIVDLIVYKFFTIYFQQLLNKKTIRPTG